jgi:hypothetical protein
MNQRIKTITKLPKEGRNVTKLENASKTKVFMWMSIENFLLSTKWYEHNRGGKIDWARVHQMADSIANRDTDWMVAPIIVDSKTKTVLDGWNTGHALAEAKEKYGYDEEVGTLFINLPKGVTVSYAVKELNNKRKGWTLEMYILDYIRNGIDDYRRLKEMAEALGEFFVESDGDIRWRYTAALKGKSQQNELKTGVYTLSEKDMQDQIETGTEVLGLWEAAGKPKIGPWMEGFIIAWCNAKAPFGKKAVSFAYKKLVNSFKNGKLVFDGTSQAGVWSQRFGDILFSE